MKELLAQYGKHITPQLILTQALRETAKDPQTWAKILRIADTLPNPYVGR